MMNRVPGIAGGVAVVETGCQTAVDPDFEAKDASDTCHFADLPQNLLGMGLCVVFVNFNVATSSHPMSGLAKTGVADYAQDPKETANQMTANRAHGENVRRHLMAVVGLTKKRAG